MKLAFLFASLCLSFTMGESVLVWSRYPSPFAAGQQGGIPSFQNAKAGDAPEVGGVKLRGCPPGRFVMGSPLDEPGRWADYIGFRMELQAIQTQPSKTSACRLAAALLSSQQDRVPLKLRRRVHCSGARRLAKSVAALRLWTRPGRFAPANQRA